jgi:magnesium chelatase subunit I
VAVDVPAFLEEVVAGLTHHLRLADEVNQRSGVSVRFTIGAYETMVAGAVRRAVRTGSDRAVPRVVDLWPVVDAALGRVEFDTLEQGNESQIVAQALRHAILDVWRDRLAGADVARLLRRFDEQELVVSTGELVPPEEFLAQFGGTPDGLADWVGALDVTASDPGTMASVAEFVLEGLHLGRRLSKAPDDHDRAVFSRG